MALLLFTTTLVAGTPPTVTVAPDWKPVPKIVRVVPPAGVPQLGEIEAAIGGETYVYPFVPPGERCSTASSNRATDATVLPVIWQKSRTNAFPAGTVYVPCCNSHC